MKTFLNFLVVFFVIYGFNTFGTDSIIDDASTVQVEQMTKPELVHMVLTAENPDKLNLTELVKLILTTIGGVLSTILISFLRKKFPDYFTDVAIKRKFNKYQ